MRIRTLNKRRKIKARMEYIIKKLMKKYKISRKEIHFVVFEGKNGVKYKYYICVNKSKIVNYFPSFELKPHFNIGNPIGELEHPSVVKNENKYFK